MELTIIFAILTFISVLITATLGAMAHGGKPVFIYHRIFAGLSVLLALIEVVLLLV